MGKIALGIAIGATLASILFVAFDQAPSSGITSPPSAMPGASESETVGSEGAISGSSVGRELPNQGAGRSALQASGEAGEASTIGERGISPVIDSQSAEFAASESETPPAQRLSISERFKAWEELGNAVFEREPIDPIWAAQAETDVNGYLAENPAIINKYGVPTIRCRSTACVAVFVSYDPALAEAVTEAGSTGGSLFIDDNEGFFETSWGQEFTGQIGILASSWVENGAVRTLWTIGKKEQQTNSIGSARASLQ